MEHEQKECERGQDACERGPTDETTRGKTVRSRLAGGPARVPVRAAAERALGARLRLNALAFEVERVRTVGGLTDL